MLAMLISVSNVSAASVTANQVANASANVKSHVETDHAIPNSVNISGNQVSMPTYLELSTAAVLNINKSSNAAIPIKSFGSAPSPSETVTSRNISKTDYLAIANHVKSFMDANGRAPNYAAQASTGSTIRYESLIYMYSKILNFYNANKYLPAYVTVNPWSTVIKSDVIGSTSYGYVEKKIYGNQSSGKTIVLIIGVHPQENGIHKAIADTLASLSGNLSKRYVLYKITVTKDADDYNKGRMNGQLLAQQFIVPDVASENPMLVLDNHENHGADSGYAHYRFLYPISNTSITTAYANEIISKMPFLVIYSPPNPTSTQYVTQPIANKGITTMIYETYYYDSAAKKASDANSIINALDDIGADTTKPTVTSVDPAKKSVNVPSNKVIKVTFNESVKAGTMWVELKNSSGTVIPITKSINGAILTITPTNPLTESKYTLILHTNSIKDLAGNPLELWSSNFSVGTSPTVTSVDPSNKAVSVPANKIIKVTFSESVKAGTMWVELKNSGGTVIPLTKSVSGNILTITPTNPLTNGTTYTVILHTGSITDLTGNPITLWTSHFTTI